MYRSFDYMTTHFQFHKSSFHTTLKGNRCLKYIQFIICRIFDCMQGRSQPHSPGWVGKSSIFFFFPQISIKFSYFSSNFTYFVPHFGPPGGRVAYLGRPWLRH